MKANKVVYWGTREEILELQEKLRAAGYKTRVKYISKI
jgi:hypothetical protein